MNPAHSQSSFFPARIVGALLFLAAAFLNLPAHAEANSQGRFAAGNSVSFARAQGNLTMMCQVGSDQRSVLFDCGANLFTPGAWDHFLGPKSVGGAEIRLTSQRADGRSVTQSRNYNDAQGSSTRAFNLGIRTVTQTPLLAVGSNQINWALLDANETLISGGVFTTILTETPSVNCRHEVLFARNQQECEFSSLACDRYWAIAQCQ